MSLPLEPGEYGSYRALEAYDILFLEDVLPAVYPDEIKILGQRTTIPIVGSELLMTRCQVREARKTYHADNNDRPRVERRNC